MKKSLRMILICLCVLSFALPALADTADKCLVPAAAGMYLFPDGVPDGLEADGRVGDPVRLFYHVQDKQYRPEYASKVEISFVSGDESLKDALTAREDPPEQNPDGASWSLFFDQSVPAGGPASAVFHMIAESESGAWEQDITLYCIPWKGNEAFALPLPENLAYALEAGQETIIGKTVLDAVLPESSALLASRMQETFPDPDLKTATLLLAQLETQNGTGNGFSLEFLDGNPVQALIIKGMGLNTRVPLEVTGP